MKLSIEKTILGCLTIALVVYAFNNLSAHPEVILFRLSEIFIFLASFFFMVFRWTGDAVKTWNTKKRWSMMAAIWGVSWLIIGLTKISMDLTPDHEPILISYFVHEAVIRNLLESMIPGLGAGIIYGTVRYTILTKETLRLKILGGVAGASLAVYSGIFFWNMSYSGSDTVTFLDRNQQLDSLEEVLAQPELMGKPVYIDLWFSTCGPCIAAFQNLAPGKEILEKNNVSMLYLGREISIPDSKSRWLSTIRDYKLEGYHVYMSEQLEREIADLIKINTDQHLGYPHYLMVDKTGTVINWDAPGITETTLLEKMVSDYSNSKEMAAK